MGMKMKVEDGSRKKRDEVQSKDLPHLPSPATPTPVLLLLAVTGESATPVADPGHFFTICCSARSPNLTVTQLQSPQEAARAEVEASAGYSVTYAVPLRRHCAFRCPLLATLKSLAIIKDKRSCYGCFYAVVKSLGLLRGGYGPIDLEVGFEAVDGAVQWKIDGLEMACPTMSRVEFSPTVICKVCEVILRLLEAPKELSVIIHQPKDKNMLVDSFDEGGRQACDSGMTKVCFLSSVINLEFLI
ncbi:hypothetical protein Cgig2_002738 [Carnegiea gigantea]|uniref:Uncharacterized protein n=1 Tax=Carnegiea gigantea TaxID=171969 RepID=A0A9Q1QBM7_9CARY|nr:hypothetical protein Cgig2_002738 [Carnegiea gigantea]